VDVGCGNGKYMGREGVAAVGCDRSAALAGICGSRGLNALVADALAVPLRSGCGDAVLSVAVLHHLSTAARRARACGELMRLARRGGGRLFVQAWAAEQGADSRRDFSAGRDALVPWCLSRRFFPAASEASVAAAGGLLDEARGAVVFHRYVHAFCAGELEGLLVEAATQGLGAGLVAPVGVKVDRLEHLFEDRVARALKSLGLPTAQEVADLQERVAILEAALHKTAPAKAARKAPSKTSRSVASKAK